MSHPVPPKHLLNVGSVCDSEDVGDMMNGVVDAGIQSSNFVYRSSEVFYLGSSRNLSLSERFGFIHSIVGSEPLKDSLIPSSGFQQKGVVYVSGSQQFIGDVSGQPPRSFRSNEVPLNKEPCADFDDQLDIDAAFPKTDDARASKKRKAPIRRKSREVDDSETDEDGQPHRNLRRRKNVNYALSTNSKVNQVLPPSLLKKKVSYPYCSICEGALGTLMQCASFCNNHFHKHCFERMYPNSKFKEDEFVCYDCGQNTIKCVVCHVLCAVDELQLCPKPNCSHYFHKSCAEGVMEKKVSLREVKKKTRSSALCCPRHHCFTCGELKDVFPCIRCWRAFHLKCVPHLSTELPCAVLCVEHAIPKITTTLRDWDKVSIPNMETEILDVRFKIPYNFKPFFLDSEYISEEQKLLYQAKGEIVADGSDLEEDSDSETSAKVLKVGVSAPRGKLPKFRKVSQNVYVSGAKPKALRLDDVSICNCSVGLDCADDYCVNRVCQIECDPRTCPAGENCQNQRLQRKQYSKIQIIKTENRGYGAIAKEDIPAGSLVIEYCGELIDEETRNRRLMEMQEVGDTNYYFFSIDSNTIVDAGRRGSLARFLNHSCDPNCVTQKWTVGNQTRVGIYSKRDVRAGEELTYDYNFLGFWEDGKGHKCQCGSQNCSGFFGQRPLKMNPKSSTPAPRKGGKHSRQKFDISEEVPPVSKKQKLSESTEGKSNSVFDKKFLAATDEMSSVHMMSNWMNPLLHHTVDPYATAASENLVYLQRNRRLVFDDLKKAIAD
eukprot:TRINITY_DN17916_c0_g1_i1.p1 TRINITY_DN17916_c0_g1~~TRINITY_DN17916_c0_g1_i1.p1  ORF type:complete len:904 (-),score=191.04 TRINITY_DN17916_c0_g1_i1:360-2681(-)